MSDGAGSKRKTWIVFAAIGGGVALAGGIVVAWVLTRPDPPISPDRPARDAGIDTAVDARDACVANVGVDCGSCGGTIQCDGRCSHPTPGNFGQPCGCEGAVKCDGRCSQPAPANLGQPCGNCGGTTTCSGCSKTDPTNFGQPCGHCGGTITCAGACSKADPGNFGQSCGCGGAIRCDGSCSQPAPANLGQPCGSCGGTMTCNDCSVATPPDLGQVISHSTHPDQIACCFVNEERSYGGACHPGYVYDDVEIAKHSGGGVCELAEAGSGRNCMVKVRWQNRGLEGAACTITIKQKRACN